MPNDFSNELVVSEQMELVLGEMQRVIARTVDPTKLTSLRAKAEAARKYAQAAALGLEMQNRAAEIKLRAERRAGELLSQLRLRGGDRRAPSNSRDGRLKLAELGISQNQSTRWQKAALVPERAFRR